MNSNSDTLSPEKGSNETTRSSEIPSLIQLDLHTPLVNFFLWGMVLGVAGILALPLVLFGGLGVPILPPREADRIFPLILAGGCTPLILGFLFFRNSTSHYFLDNSQKAIVCRTTIFGWKWEKIVSRFSHIQAMTVTCRHISVDMGVFIESRILCVLENGTSLHLSDWKQKSFGMCWKNAQTYNGLIGTKLVSPREGYQATPKKKDDGSFSFILEPGSTIPLTY